MAPVAKRFTISFADSTSSSGSGFSELFQLQQSAQSAELLILLIDQIGVFPEGFASCSAAPNVAAC